MNKFLKTVVILVVIVTTFNCAPVKLSNAWSSDNFDATKSEKILIIARSNDAEVRQAYENELTSKLKAEGINAVASYKIFPDLKDKASRTKVETEEIVKQFKAKGIQSVMLTALKDTKLMQSTQKEGGNNYNKSTINKGQYGFTFVDYYSVHSIEYISRNLRPNYNANDSNNTEDIVLESTTYILEAALYDLTLEQRNQLVGAYEVQITDPNSGKQVLNKFSNLIVKQFKK